MLAAGLSTAAEAWDSTHVHAGETHATWTHAQQ